MNILSEAFCELIRDELPGSVVVPSSLSEPGCHVRMDGLWVGSMHLKGHDNLTYRCRKLKIDVSLSLSDPKCFTTLGNTIRKAVTDYTRRTFPGWPEF